MLSVTLRLLICSAITYAAWRAIGPIGIAWCAPLFGAALARPILDGLAESHRFMRALVYRDIEGRHCAYMGTSISVVEDADGFRWLRLSDVRKILPDLSRDEFLQRSLGAGVGPVLPDRCMRIQAEALVAHLGRTTHPDTAKFSRWVERTIVFPSQKTRQRNASAADRLG